MAGKLSDRSRSSQSGAAAATRRSGFPVFPASRGRLLLGIGVAALALTVFFLAGGMGRPHKAKRTASTAKKQDSSEKVTTRRPLPADLTEDQVPKWVPYRQVSGRVELEAWDSVDADCVRDPYARFEVMDVRERAVSRSEEDTEASADNPPDSPTKAAAEEAEQGEGLGEEAPADTEEQQEGLEDKAPLSVDPAEEELDEEPPVPQIEAGDPGETAG